MSRLPKPSNTSRSERKPSLNLIVAPAGYGKTYYCLEQFKRLMRRARDLTQFQSYYLVPTKEHTDRIRDLILRDPDIRTIPSNQVTTFDGFVRSLMREADHVLVSEVLKNIFIKEILHTSKLEYFTEARHWPGFIEALGDFIGEVKESHPDVETFVKNLDALAPVMKSSGRHNQISRGKKFGELALILDKYEKKLRSEGLLDIHDTARVLRSYINFPDRCGKTADTVVVDGFFEFTKTQEEVIRYLTRTASNMIVTLTTDMFDPKSATARFEAVETTRGLLNKMGFKSIPFASENKRVTNEVLKHVEKRLFSPADGLGIGNRDGEVVILEAPGVREEMEMIAREIRKLYAAGRYHFSDFCLIFRHIGYYAQIIKTVLADFKIPVVVHERNMLRHNAFASGLLSLLKVYGDGWKSGDVLSYLKSSLFDDTDRLVARIERYVYERGNIEGREAWQASWNGFPSAWDARRREAIEEIVKIENQFRSITSAEGHVIAMTQFIRNKLMILPDIRTRNTRMSTDAAAVRRIFKIMDELSFSYRERGGEEVTFDEFLILLSRTIEVSLYSDRSWGKNRVQVYDISIARQKEFKVVFMAGLLERTFPRRVQEDPILKDEERVQINKYAKGFLKERLPRQSVERYLFYLGATRSSERLYLTYPRFERDGREAMPSFYIEDMKQALGEAASFRLMRATEFLPEPKESRTIEELERAAILKLFEPNDMVGQRDYTNADRLKFEIARELATQERFSAMVKEVYRNRSRFSWAKHRRSNLASQESIELFRNRKKPFGITSLEDYAACPFRYFLAREVSLKEPDEDISLKTVGSILHKTIEDYFNSGGHLQEPEKGRMLMEQALAKAFNEWPLRGARRYQIELKEIEIKEICDAFLKDIAGACKDRVFIPAYFEHSFGDKADLDLSAPGDEEPLLVRGKIDRIDIDAHRRFALIVDYKTSEKFKMDSVEKGLKLQLPLYILAVEKSKSMKVVGGYLFSLKGLLKDEKFKNGFYSSDGLKEAGIDETQTEQLSAMGIGVRMSGVLSQEAYRNVIDTSVHWAKTYAEGIRNSAFPVYPKDCVAYCKYKAVCRIEPWMIDRIQYELTRD